MFYMIGMFLCHRQILCTITVISMSKLYFLYHEFILYYDSFLYLNCICLKKYFKLYLNIHADIYINQNLYCINCLCKSS